MDQRKLFISILIMVIIGSHALPILQKLEGKRQTFWPFMAWGMYKKSRDPRNLPVTATIRRVIGITAEGEEIEVDSRLVGLLYSGFYRAYLLPIGKGDLAVTLRLVERLNIDRKDPIVELYLERETYIITDTGVVKENNEAVIYRATEG